MELLSAENFRWPQCDSWWRIHSFWFTTYRRLVRDSALSPTKLSFSELKAMVMAVIPIDLLFLIFFTTRTPNYLVGLPCVPSRRLIPSYSHICILAELDEVRKPGVHVLNNCLTLNHIFIGWGDIRSCRKCSVSTSKTTPHHSPLGIYLLNHSAQPENVYGQFFVSRVGQQVIGEICDFTPVLVHWFEHRRFSIM